MNEILKINLNENQEPIISGRELHQVLEVNSNYTLIGRKKVCYLYMNN